MFCLGVLQLQLCREHSFARVRRSPAVTGRQEFSPAVQIGGDVLRWFFARADNEYFPGGHAGGASYGTRPSCGSCSWSMS